MKCTDCGKEIPVNTPPSENWEHYCAECGMKRALKEIRASNKYYRFEPPKDKGGQNGSLSNSK